MAVFGSARWRILAQLWHENLNAWIFGMHSQEISDKSLRVLRNRIFFSSVGIGQQVRFVANRPVFDCMKGHANTPLNTLGIIHIFDQQGRTCRSCGQRNWRIIQRIRKLGLHKALCPDLIKQVAEGIELLCRRSMFLAEIATWKAQELDASRTQARDHLRVIAHKSLTAGIFGTRSSHRKNVAAKQVWAEREAFIKINAYLRFTTDLHVNVVIP